MHLLLGEKFRRVTLIAFCRYGEHALAVQCQRRFVQGNVLEEGMHSGQTGISRARRVASATLKMVKELGEKSSIEILYSQFRGRPFKLFGSILKQQTEGIAVAGYRMRTGAELVQQSIGKEMLKEGWQGLNVHLLCTCTGAPNRSAAS
jgi:hypothetical protein